MIYLLFIFQSEEIFLDMFEDEYREMKVLIKFFLVCFHVFVFL